MAGRGGKGGTRGKRSRGKSAKGRSTPRRAARGKRAGRPAATRSAPKAAAPRVAAITARLKRAEERVASLEKQLVRLERQRAAEKQAQRRRLTGARRGFEAQLTRMVQEIGQLRLHEARARALERVLAEHGIEASAQAPAVPSSGSRAKVREPSSRAEGHELQVAGGSIDPEARRP